MNSDAKTVRGLSIAVVILSALFILLAFAGFAMLALFGVAANDPAVISQLDSELQQSLNSSSAGSQYFDDDYMYYQTIGDMDAATIVNMILGFGGIFLALGLACSVVPLIAGIFGIKNCTRPEKYGMTFGWMIAGAVLAALMGRFITMALIIIAAVYVNKLKKNPLPDSQGFPYQQQPYQYNPYNGQPYQQQPPANWNNPPYGSNQQQGYSQPYGFDQQQESPSAQPGPTQQTANPEQPYGQQPGADEQPIAKLNGNPYDLGKPHDSNESELQR